MISLLLAAAIHPALAQTATAYAAFPYAGSPVGRDRVRISDTDFVVLRQVNETEFALERRTEDLALVWTAPVRAPAESEPLLGLNLRSLLGFEGNFERWPAQALVVDDAQVSFLVAHDEGLRATRIDLESGAWIADEDILVSTERPGIFVSEDRQAIAAFTGGTRSAALRASVWDSSLELLLELPIPNFDAAREVRIDAAGRRIEEHRVSFSLDDSGNIYQLANPMDRRVVIRQIDTDGVLSTIVADLGEGEVDRVSLSFGDSGRAYLTGAIQQHKLLRTTHAGVVVSALDFDTQQTLWVSTVSPDQLARSLSPSAEPLEAATLELHNPTALLEAPSGQVLFATQHQAVKTSTSTNTTTTTLEFEDLALYAFSPDGELLWTSALDVNQSLPAGVGNPQVGQLAWVTDDALRFVLMEFRPQRFGSARAVTLREVSLDDGAVSAPLEVAPLPSKHDIFFEQLTLIMDDDTLVLASRVGVEEDMGLLTQVDLTARPSPPAPLMPALVPDLDDPDYQAGRIVGGQHALGAARNTVFGLAKGGPITAAATVGGAFFSPITPMACLAGPAVGCVGGAAMAGLLTQGPGDVPIASFSPQFQAGYLDGWRRYARRKQLRWALVGAGAGAVVAFVPARIIAGTLANATAQP